MKLRDSLSHYWQTIQTKLFPDLEEKLGPLTSKLLQVVEILEMVRVESHVRCWGGYVGRPADDRCALARAFVAKAVLNLATTRMLLDRLAIDMVLRRICGWERKNEVPSESTFSRAFEEFAEEDLPSRVHEALILETQGRRLIGHVSRDSTPIEARERPEKKATKELRDAATLPKKRGRRKKGEDQPVSEPCGLARQATQSLSGMLSELPRTCDVGTKRNSKGHTESWIGYKLHIDTADGDLPVSALLTSASVHDSRVAIPLATMTAARVTNCYDLMDSAYDAQDIRDYSVSLGHVPLIDKNPRRDLVLREALETEAKARNTLHFTYPEDVRYNERSSAERVNSNMKDNFGGRMIRVRGDKKVFCHLMFGILAMTANQLIRLISS